MMTREASHDRFAGTWDVHEDVYGADGRRIGTIAQRRAVSADDHGGLRVIQDCTPEPGLARHPIAGFRGHHEFTVVRDGARRRYLGPAVIGAALELDDGVMIGRGLWPVLGWSFSSWSLRVSADRQLTGGTFRRGDGVIATLVGVGAPAGSDCAPLAGTDAPEELAARWSGRWRRLAGNGAVLASAEVTRDHRDGGWRGDGGVAEQVLLTGGSGGLLATGEHGGVALVGAGRRLGPVLELELWLGPARVIEVLEVLDRQTRTLTCVRRHLRDGVLDQIDLLRLRPQGAFS